MTLRGTLGLLAVAAALAGYLLLVPAPAPPPTESMLSVPVESVDAVEIVWAGSSLHARRTEHGWRTPGGAPVPPDAIRELLAALSTLRPTETLRVPEAAEADYGFDAHAARLVVSATGAPVLELEVGDRNPAWTGVYVRRIGSNEIAVVGALLHWELEKLRAIATR